jgi:hypothetical protein
MYQFSSKQVSNGNERRITQLSIAGNKSTMKIGGE